MARNCFLLASAVIFASGGYHFFLGENKLIEEKVEGVFIASPDRNNGKAEKLIHEYMEGIRSSYIRFTVPRLNIWDLIWIKVG